MAGGGKFVAAAWAMVCFLLVAACFPATAAAPDIMSIISYNSEHGVRGLGVVERTEAEARAVYDLWVAQHGRSATCCKDHSTCCPKDYPVCNAKARPCSKSKNSPYTVEALIRTPAMGQQAQIVCFPV
ncbi:hypothetical protein E2562_005133 [Oryza meyeriana var. granulata]|uniref:Granulins domain-containing protein n=1 Tax=Oryza meyeriana var. granulata TaxID=110450 RepID=A0A6G1BST3_9ORYZ|nr:hypothetical protein E2562_005133 [Oryza meyeriana var. granulata]